MQIIEIGSYYRIEKNFSLSELDQEVLEFLYLPIVKVTSLAVYRFFCSYASIHSDMGLFSHEETLKLINLSDTDFLFARNQLEAIGLLETLRKEDLCENGQNKVSYIYCLKPPASPKKFFDDVLLRTLLCQYVGQKRYFFLTNYFRINKVKNEEQYVDVSARFKDIFSPVVKEGDVCLEPIKEEMVDKKYKTQAKFDRKALKEALRQQQYPFDFIKKDIKEIENICSLYEPDLDKTVSLIINNTDLDGIFYLNSFVSAMHDLNKYQSTITTSHETVSGENANAKMINQFTSITPEEYLSVIYNGKPAVFMLEEIDRLKTTLSFSNGVINVILDYCLKRTNYEFNSTFIEKVAYSLSSKHISTPYEAMVTLTSRDFEANQVKTRRKSHTQNKPDEEKEESNQDEDLLKGLGL